jgi:hypothetical protein
MNIHVDSRLDDDWRAALYRGDLFVLSASAASSALAELARELLIEAFEPHDPREAQYHVAVDDYAAILSDVKPHFIHHPRCKELIPALMSEAGCDVDQIYYDVPRLRSATAAEYLTTGIAYAFHPHRDTWYSAPFAQLNWWLPVYPIEPENGLAFHPRYFDEPVRNSSSSYNYYRWNADSRAAAASMVGKDTREQPKPLDDVELDPQVRVVAPVGAPLVFSAAHLHSSVPNTSAVTRFSIDFRTVHLGDLRAERAARNIDAACTGTTLRDFRSCLGGYQLPEDVIARYDDDSASEYSETLVYSPPPPESAVGT